MNSPDSPVPPLFHNIPPNGSDFAYRAAFRLMKRAWARGLIHVPSSGQFVMADTRWSVIEVGWEDPDWRAIDQWLRIGSPCPSGIGIGTIRDALRLSSDEVNSILFLCGCVAVAREAELDVELWARVYDRFGHRLRSKFFGSNEYPQRSTLDGLVQIVNRFYLRNDLEIAGVHKFWRTVSLHYGLPGFGGHRLGYWLAGQGIPITVQSLLDAFGPNYSPRFVEFWKALVACRSLRSTRPLESIEENPWYDSSCSEQLFEFAVQHLEHYHSPLGEGENAEETEETGCLFSAPRLVRNEIDDYEFELPLSPNLPACLKGEEFRLHIGENSVRMWRNLDNGELRIEDEFVRVKLVTRTLDAAVYLGGSLQYLETVELWGEHQSLQIFDHSTGRQIEGDGFSVEKDHKYAFLVDPDVQFNSQPDEVVHFGNRKLAVFSRVPPELTASLRQREIWSVEFVKEHLQERDPAATASFTYGQLGAAVPLKVEVHNGTDVAALCIGKQLLMRLVQGSTQFDPLRLLPGVNLNAKGLPTYALVHEGLRLSRAPVRFRPGRVVGAAVQIADGWIVFDGWKTVDAAEVSGRKLQILFPEADCFEPEWYLCEGIRPIKRAASSVLLSGLAGCGEPLVLRESLLQGRCSPLSPAVINSGNLSHVSSSGAQHQLELRHPSEWIHEYDVLVWPAEATMPYALPHECCTSLDDRTIIVTAYIEKPLAWAISHEGRWKGAKFVANPDFASGWRDATAQFAASLYASSDWRNTAAWLRWWRIPVLMEPFRPAVASQVPKNQCTTLTEWIRQGEIHSADNRPFLQSIDDNLWSVAVRGFDALWNWHPDSSESAALLLDSGAFHLPDEKQIHVWTEPGVTGLDIIGKKNALHAPLEALLRANPVLLAHIVTHAFDDSNARPVLGLLISELRTRVDELCRKRLSVAYQGTERPISESDRFDAICGQLAIGRSDRGIDEHFLTDTVVNPARKMFNGDLPFSDSDRLRAAVGRSYDFSCWIAHQLISDFGIGVTRA